MIGGLSYREFALLARYETLTNLKLIRLDPDAMAAAGVTNEQVSAAFEVVRAVSDHYNKEQAS